MVNKYDTIVIGSGPGGMSVAGGLASNQKVLTIENKLWGGTCPNRGCDPKKIMYGVVETYLQAKRFQNAGIGELKPLNWHDLRRFVHEYIDTVDEKMKKGLDSQGIETIDGAAKIISEHQVKVDNRVFEAENIVIAAGSKALVLDIPGKEYLSISDDFFTMKELPEKIGFIGAGFVALELANIANALGVEVHIFQRNHNLIDAIPEDFNKQLAIDLSGRGVKIHFDTEVNEVTKDDNELVAHTNNGDVQLDMLISSIGRPAAISELGLDELGLEYDKHGIIVDDHLRTNFKNIYAIGDVVSHKLPKLTSISSMEGSFVAETILGQNKPISYPAIPFIAFTSPQLGQVGITEAKAKEHPEKYEITVTDVGSWYNYFRMKDSTAKVMTIIDKDSDLLVGAAIIGHQTEELINQFANIISQKKTKAEVHQQMAVYPTFSSDLPYLY